jgi:dinuclear metal center YbgI/SA1388 family protein
MRDLKELDSWCRSLLEIDALASIDDSLNGIQVGRSDTPVDRVAFAVDACAETIRRAVEAKAQVLFVHHGLFWGRSARLEGSLLERVRLLVDSDLALYACHLPLDKHPQVGNNAVLARMLGLSDLEEFGDYHGQKLGFAGSLEPSISLEEAIRRILPDGSAPRCIIPAGEREIRRAAIVSGGAPFEALQAIAAGIDLYVTGEPSHSIYHAVLEGGIAFLAAGHYATEVWGVKAVAERLAREAGVQTLFIDLPTGL